MFITEEKKMKLSVDKKQVSLLKKENKKALTKEKELPVNVSLEEDSPIVQTALEEEAGEQDVTSFRVEDMDSFVEDDYDHASDEYEDVEYLEESDN